MQTLREAIDAKATPNQRAAMRAEEWCARNPEWECICNINPDDYGRKIIQSYDDMPEEQQANLIQRFKGDARIAWETLGVGEYKVEAGYIMDDGTFITPAQWLATELSNRGFMMVFKINPAKGRKHGH